MGQGPKKESKNYFLQYGSPACSYGSMAEHRPFQDAQILSASLLQKNNE